MDMINLDLIIKIKIIIDIVSIDMLYNFYKYFIFTNNFL